MISTVVGPGGTRGWRVQNVTEVEAKLQVQLNGLRMDTRKLKDRIEILEAQVRRLVDSLERERRENRRLSEVLLLNGIRED
jgi:cell division protein FtsB